MKKDEFDQLRAWVDKRLDFGGSREMALGEMSSRLMVLPEVHARCANIGFQMTLELGALEEKAKSLKGRLEIDLKTNPEKKSHPRYHIMLKTKEDVENQLYSYDEWSSLMREIVVVKAQAEYMDRLVDRIKSFGYSMKNLIDVEKLRAGM